MPGGSKNHAFTGEVFLGHLRYGTYGRNTMSASTFLDRTTGEAGPRPRRSFNLTNVDELFDILVELGQHPKEKADTVTVLEKVGHFLDDEVEKAFRQYKNAGHENAEISGLIADRLDMANVLRRASVNWDGGT